MEPRFIIRPRRRSRGLLTVLRCLVIGTLVMVLTGPAMGDMPFPLLRAGDYCTDSGLRMRCFVDNYLWGMDNGGASWAIADSENKGMDDLRFELRSGDIWPLDAAKNHPAERTEISKPHKTEPVETDIWFAFGMLVEPGAVVTSKWQVLGQLHPTDDPGDMAPSPAWAQELNAGDVFRIVVRASAEKPLQHNPPAKVLYVDQNFQRGSINHFVYRLRYSQTHGLLQVWRDGQQIVDYQGPLGYVDRLGPFFKFGIYRQPAAEKIVVHYYALRFGGPELKP